MTFQVEPAGMAFGPPVSWPGLVITVLYFILFEGLWGATPGKRLMRLRVADALRRM